MSDTKLENFTSSVVGPDLAARNECVHWTATAVDGTDKREGRFRGTSTFGALALAQTELAKMARASCYYHLVLIGPALEQLGSWLVYPSMN